MRYATDIDKLLDRFIGVPIVILLGGLCSKKRSSSETPLSSNLSLKQIKRILLIQISAIGDVVLLTPALRAIRSRFPTAHISMICSSLNYQLLKPCPYLDEVMVLDLTNIRNPIRFIKFISQLRKRKFDLSIDFEHWPRLTAILSYMIGAPRRLGFQAEGQHRHHVFTDVVAHLRGRHELLMFMDLVKTLGGDWELDSKNLEPEIWLDEADIWTGQFLEKNQVDPNKPIVAIHPDAGRGQPRRRWNLDGYAEVAQALAEQNGAQIIITGSPAEVKLAQQLASKMTAKTTKPVEPIIAAGLTNISQLTALLARCDLLLCGNCGPMHLAAAVKIPVVALHGPTNPIQWGPWGKGHIVLKADLPCHPCLNLGFEYGCKALSDGTSMCMHTIHSEDVLEACQLQLNKRSALS